MKTLEQRLQVPPDHLTEFFHNAVQGLTYLRDNGSTENLTSAYSLYQLRVGKKTISSRPVRTSLLIADPEKFLGEAQRLAEKLSQLFGSKDMSQGPAIDRVLYTAMMAHACVFDALLGTGAARRSTGVVFSALMGTLLRAGGTDTRPLSFAMSTKAGVYHYPVNVVANRTRVESSSKVLSSNDVLISCMTTTKERLTKIFADKMMLESYCKKSLTLAVIALHDVQRKGTQGVTWTFLPRPFLLNSTHVAPLQGLYYLDLPEPALAPAFRGLVRPVHELVLDFPA